MFYLSYFSTINLLSNNAVPIIEVSCYAGIDGKYYDKMVYVLKIGVPNNAYLL